MIVSVSRRTDIPAFYGDWFINRIQEGFFININPYNRKYTKKYSLFPEDIDTIVFWTKNPEPFIKHLPLLNERGYNYYFQYTLNNYPKIFEPNVPAFKNRLNNFLKLSNLVGPDRVVWRFDPIIISSITSIDHILDQIDNIARRVRGHTKRLVISFMDFYGKVTKRISLLRQRDGIDFTDIAEMQHREQLLYLCREISNICKGKMIKVFTCTEFVDLQSSGIAHGSCIDGKLIQQILKIDKKFPRDRGQRKGCYCAASVDMGIYNTCNFQCVYCYANSSEKELKKNVEKHRVGSPILIEL